MISWMRDLRGEIKDDESQCVEYMLIVMMIIIIMITIVSMKHKGDCLVTLEGVTLTALRCQHVLPSDHHVSATYLNHAWVAQYTS